MTASTARFLDPKVLARISSLDLLAKTVVEGFISGLHRSPFLGRSMDFAEYRPYLPGDDIRQIDWKLYSRTDRYYVKEFEGDTNTNLNLMLDISKSMDFGTGAMTKFDYARTLAACLGYFANRQRDRIGLITFDDDIRLHVPPAAKHVDLVLRSLATLEPGGDSDLRLPVSKVGSRLRRRSIVVLISDFYEPPESVLTAVGGLNARGNDVILFHVLDPAELDLPYDQPLDLQDLESGEKVAVVPDALRDQYRELVKSHIDELSRSFTKIGIDYNIIDTSKPLDFALYNYLSARLWSQKCR